MRSVQLRRGHVTREEVAAAFEMIGVEQGDYYELHAAPDTPSPDEDERGPLGKRRTSQEAAMANEPGNHTQRRDVVLALALHAQTRDELVVRLGLGVQSLTARVKGLIDGGWVQATDRTRPTRKGRNAEVLELTPKAREWLDGIQGSS